MQRDLSNCKISGAANGKLQTATLATFNNSVQYRYMIDALANNIAGFTSIERFQPPSSS